MKRTGISLVYVLASLISSCDQNDNPIPPVTIRAEECGTVCRAISSKIIINNNNNYNICLSKRYDEAIETLIILEVPEALEQDGLIDLELPLLSSPNVPGGEAEFAGMLSQEAQIVIKPESSIVISARSQKIYHIPRNKHIVGYISIVTYPCNNRREFTVNREIVALIGN